MSEVGTSCVEHLLFDLRVCYKAVREFGPRGPSVGPVEVATWLPTLPDLSAERGSDRLQHGLVAIFRDVSGLDLDDQPPCPIL